MLERDIVPCPPQQQYKSLYGHTPNIPQTTSGWRASAPIGPPLRDLVVELRTRLHMAFPQQLTEWQNGYQVPVARPIPPHVELVNPRYITAYPDPLTQEERDLREQTRVLISRCQSTRIDWLAGSGTGHNTTATLALIYDGPTKACRGMHTTLAAARVRTLIPIDRDAILEYARAAAESDSSGGSAMDSDSS